jgi:PTS system nitrogen regulatory IIA component
MSAGHWLSVALTGVADTTLDALLSRATGVLAEAACVEPERIEAAFRVALGDDGWSVGSGVALPHTELPDVSETVVCLITLAAPLSLSTIDGHAPDVFVFILSKPDPKHHLMLLAHLARLLRSRTLVEGLRRADSPDAVSALVEAAELRHAGTPGPLVPAPSGAIVVIIVSGENAVDALLVDLVDQGHADACILEAQSVREAAAREVPLFAGFRDIFGDPGGRRVILVESPMDRVDGVMASARRICDEHAGSDVRVSVVPVSRHWAAPAPAVEERSGH